MDKPMSAARGSVQSFRTDQGARRVSPRILPANGAKIARIFGRTPREIF